MHSSRGTSSYSFATLHIIRRETVCANTLANSLRVAVQTCTLYRFDQDSNGVMDRQEFKSFMEHLFGRRVAVKEVETMFREINVDEEQTIDSEEFKGFCFGSGRFGEAGRYMKDILSPRPKTAD